MSEIPTETPTQTTNQLRRAREGRMVAGVCAGVGRYTGIDPNIIRVALAVSVFFGGLGIALYAVAWLLIPEEGKPTSIAQDLIDKQRGRRRPDGWQGIDDWPEPSASPYGTPGRYGTPQDVLRDTAPQDTPGSAAPYATEDAHQRTVWRPAESGPEAGQAAEPEKSEEAEKAAATHRPAERPGTDA